MITLKATGRIDEQAIGACRARSAVASITSPSMLIFLYHHKAAPTNRAIERTPPLRRARFRHIVARRQLFRPGTPSASFAAMPERLSDQPTDANKQAIARTDGTVRQPDPVESMETARAEDPELTSIKMLGMSRYLRVCRFHGVSS